MSNRWNPHYRRIVLERGFETHRNYFFYPMMEASAVHVLMLARQGIMDGGQARRLLEACVQVLGEGPEHFVYDPRFEDLFFFLEHKLAELAGEEAVGNMHVAMSRNDLDTAMYRLVLREEVLAAEEALLDLRRALLAAAEEHVHTVMPAYTHNQQAQPTTMAHYLAAVEAEFAKDQARFAELWPRLNRSPLGAAALATSGFPIDRDFVARLLGFDGIVENSYEAVASADFSAEYAAAVHIMLGHLSRFVTDVLFWVTNEVAAVRLHPSLIQVSSIMPQKRNPVAAEHLRAFASRAMNDAVAVLQQMHNVPYGDINDVNDDLQPTLRRLSGETVDLLLLLADVVSTMQVDRELLLERAAAGFAPITELADTLVREAKLSFRTAHRIVSGVVDGLNRQNKTLRDLDLARLDAVAMQATGRPSGLSEEGVRRAVDPVHFVKVRSVTGGPAPEEMGRALRDATARCRADERDVRRRRTGLEEAAAKRRALIEKEVRLGAERF